MKKTARILAVILAITAALSIFSGQAKAFSVFYTPDGTGIGIFTETKSDPFLKGFHLSGISDFIVSTFVDDIWQDIAIIDIGPNSKNLWKTCPQPWKAYLLSDVDLEDPALPIVTGIHGDPIASGNSTAFGTWEDGYFFADNQLEIARALGITAWGTSLSASFTRDDETAATPEPGTMILLGLGLIGLAFFSKKFQTARA